MITGLGEGLKHSNLGAVGSVWLGFGMKQASKALVHQGDDGHPPLRHASLACLGERATVAPGG